MKKALAIVLAAAMAFGMAACGGNTTSTNTSTGTSTSTAGTSTAGEGKVYYLNFKPEQADDWVELAAEYTKQTGVPVDVVTAASNTYESTLKAEMAKSNAPTLFQVNGPVGLASWKDYCYNLADSELYSHLSSDSFALKEGDNVYGIAYVIETYGLIYNKALLNEYMAKDYAVIKSVDELNNFETLKAVAEDITAHKDDLGFAAFTSAGMDSSSDWRFKTHLANLPVYYEYKADGITSTAAIKGTYLENYKNIWDLYINNATCQPTMLGSKTGDEAASEFAMGEAVFYQNGTWAYNDIKDYEVADEDMGMMPIYIGAEGEENQGLCTGSENYWCVNSKASAEDIQATLDFVNWCVTSDTGREAVIKSVDELNNFETLKAVAEDITAHKDDLGFAAFTSAGMDSSSDWRFKTHLANLPVYYEYKADGITSTAAIKGTYLENYKNIWDLYINNATCQPTMLGSKTGDEAASEFAMGEAVFYQNGTWAYNDIKDYEVADEDMGMMPIYIGAEGEENQGLCTGSENYWCVNSKASAEDIQATLDFVNWCVTSDTGREALKEMGFVCPFDTYTQEYLPENPLVLAANEDVAAGHDTVDWCFTTMPSEEWKNGVGAALLEYAQGTQDWSAVQTAFVDGWATEYQAANG